MVSVCEHELLLEVACQESLLVTACEDGGLPVVSSSFVALCELLVTARFGFMEGIVLGFGNLEFLDKRVL